MNADPMPKNLRRFRIRVRTLLWAIVAFAFLFAVGSCPTGAWSGSSPVTLHFRVVEADSGHAVPGATVRLVDSFLDQVAPNFADHQPVMGTTGPDGRVSLQARFRSSGSISLLRRTRHISFRARQVHVEARGFRRFVAALGRIDAEPDQARATDPPLGLRDPPPPEVTIRLRRTEGPARP